MVKWEEEKSSLLLKCLTPEPTTDIAKEGLFNVIENNLDISSLKTLDLFGGTGSISYELCSRGAKDCTIVEKDPSMFDFIKRTACRNLSWKIFIPLKWMCLSSSPRVLINLILFLPAPPYALTTIDDIPIKIFEKQLLNHNGWFILEHTPRNNYTGSPFFVTTRNYGTTIFSIFVNK